MGKRLAVVASLSFILTILVFFAADQFWIYCQFLLFNDIKPITNSAPDVPTTDVSFAPGGEGESDGDEYGQAGVKMMLLNRMNAGYYKEYLTISREHSDWTQMQVEPLMKGGEPFYPSPVFILGTGLAESGLADGTVTWAPLNPSDYNKDVGGVPAKDMNLSTVNSAVFRKIGVSHIWGDQNMDLYNDSAYTTPFQFTHWAASVSPLKDRPSDQACTPSKMNGYGFKAADIRTPAQTDIAYFPDLCSIVLQKSWLGLKDALDANSLSPEAESVSYAVYNGGIGQVLYSWSVGGPPVKSPAISPVNTKFGPSATWSDLNTVTRRQCASEAANMMGDLAEQCLDYFKTNMPDKSAFNWQNQTDYEGLWAIMSLKGGNGFIASDHCLGQLKTRVAKSAGFVRGGVLALQILGDKNATAATLSSYVNTLKVQAVDSFYGPAYIGKGGQYTEVVVHMYSDDLQVYNSAGAGPKAALHAFNAESARGMFMQAIGAYIIYWRMLLASGVEITLNDAVLDARGLLSTGDSGRGSADYYTGTGENVWVDFHTEDSELPVKWASAMEYRTSAQTGGKSVGIHGGEDFAAADGTPVCAIATGTVIKECHSVPRHAGGKEANGGAGNTVTVRVDKVNDTDPTIDYVYMHLQPGQRVTIGQRVNAGDIIGLSGDTGVGTGPHMHIEIHVYRDGNQYRMCYNALHSGWYSVKTGPKLYWDTVKGKAANGYVYNGNYEKIGYLRDPRLKHGSQNPYEILGVHFFKWRLS